MRISDRYQSSPVERVAPAQPVAAAKATGASDAASNILDIHVSAQAKALSNRAAGIEQLKASIANGTFKVDADAIAQKLVGGDE